MLMTDGVARTEVDRELGYTDGLGRPGRCRLRAWPSVRVAVVTEVEQNPGMSVTNAIEHVAMAAEAALDCRFFGTSWRLLEHYEAGRWGTDLPEDLDLVTFEGYDKQGRLKRPTWQEAPAVLASWLVPALAS